MASRRGSIGAYRVRASASLCRYFYMNGVNFFILDVVLNSRNHIFGHYLNISYRMKDVLGNGIEVQQTLGKKRPAHDPDQCMQA
jgi:hypothetical protein